MFHVINIFEVQGYRSMLHQITNEASGGAHAQCLVHKNVWTRSYICMI